MTALPTISALSTLPDLEQLRQQSQVTVDQLIQQNRQITPPSVLEQRKRQRLTIQDINRMSEEGIAAGMNPVDIGDDRSGLIRFLDIVDLPRNTVSNAIFGEATFGQQVGAIASTAGVGAAFGSGAGFVGAGIGALIGAGVGLAGILAGEAFVGDEMQRNITQSSERRGAYDQPSIYFSDVLRSMGVENRVVRAVVGFGGDIIMDPLTYLSGGGNVAVITAKNGSRIKVAAPLRLLMRDMAKHHKATTVLDAAGNVIRQGEVLAHGKYAPLKHLFNNTLQIGDELFEAGEFAKASLLERFGRNVATKLTTDQGKMGVYARELVGIYGAKSSRQFTFPFSGWLANRMRTPLDIPIGRMGRPGELRKVLAGGEEGIQQILDAKKAALFRGFEEATETVSAAKNLFHAVSQAEDLIPTEIAQARLALTTARIERVNVRRLLTEHRDTGFERLMNGMDDMMSVYARGDAYTSATGPAGLLRKLPWGHKEALELEEKIAAVNESSLRIANDIRTERTNISAELRGIDDILTEGPDVSAPLVDLAERQHFLSEDFKTLTQIEEANEIASEVALTPLRDRLKVIQDRTLYKLHGKLVELENGIFRDRGRLSAEDARIRHLLNKHRIATENELPVRAAQIAKEYDRDLQKVAKGMKGVPYEDINTAFWGQVLEKGTAQGLRGFKGDRDELVSMVEQLRQKPYGEKLLRGSTRTVTGTTEVGVTSGQANILLGQMADRYMGLMSEFWEIQRGLGLVNDVDPGFLYFFGSMTPDALRAAREFAKSKGEVLGRGGLFKAEAFTHSKATDRLFFKNARGQEDFIWSGELPNVHSPDPMIPEQAERLAQFEKWRAEQVQQFGLAEDWLPDRTPTSPFELNKHRSRFHQLVPQSFTGPMFETDLVQLISARSAAHLRSVAAESLRTDLIKLGRAIDPDTIEFYPKTAGGFLVDGVRHRALNQDLIKNASLRVPIDDATLQYYYPEALASAIEGYAKRFKNNSDVNIALQGFDSVHAIWKTTTLLHPSWWTINAVGGAINSFAGAATRPLMWPVWTHRLQGMVRKMHGLSRKQLSKTKMIKIKDMELSEYDWAELFLKEGIITPGRAAQEVLSTAKVGGFEAMMSLSNRKVVGKPIGLWFQANAATDDLWRVITFADRFDQGDDFVDAVTTTRRVLFDYGDLTDFEQQVGIRVWPFYRWMRNNIALQMKLLLDQPALASSYPKAKNAIEEAFTDEGLIPDEMRPRWMKDQIAAQIGDGPEAKFLLLSLFTPAQDMFEIGQGVFGQEGFVEALKYFMSSSNPMMKVPYEMAMGRELFTGREIGHPEFGEPSYMEYVAQQFRPYREVTRTGRLLSTADFGAADVALRAALGGRIQQFTADKLERRTAYEHGVTARQKRHTISVLRDRGDEEEAQRLSIELVDDYRDLFKLGIIDMVPKQLRAQFIREQLESQ